jgi:CyaY protein
MWGAPTLRAALISSMRRSMNDTEYHAHADALLRRLEIQMDAWLQDDVIDIDTQRSGGVLELSFLDGSKIVVNKQPPLQEIWLAARAGGFHFKWDGAVWRDTKTGAEFVALFNEQASRQARKTLVLE